MFIDSILTTPLSADLINNVISDTFNVIDRCNTVVANISATADDKQALLRDNYHLQSIVKKDWFTTALSGAQLTDINNCITTYNNYLST
jgi:hypothetical protein